MMRTFIVASLLVIASAADAGKHLRGVGNATCEQKMTLPEFDTTPFGNTSAPCAPAFDQALGASWECMKATQEAVNNCEITVEEYYPKLCSCREAFDKGMSNCTVGLDEALRNRVDATEAEFKVICEAGKAVSWLVKHKALIIGLSVFGCVGCCLCIALAVLCCCICKRK